MRSQMVVRPVAQVNILQLQFATKDVSSEAIAVELERF